MGRGLAFAVLLLLSMSFAHAATDDQRLAVLAANMQPLAGTEYALNCGPVKVYDNVLNTIDGDVKGPRYCVLKSGEEIIFGTFMQGPSGTVTEEEFGPLAKPMLEAYDDFAPHVQLGDLPDDLNLACTPDGNTDTFWPCLPIHTEYGSLYLYFYVDYDIDGGSNAYLIVSEGEIAAFQSPTIFSTVVDFFRRLFGVSPASIDEPAQDEHGAFHHAYFASQAGRTISATWQDRTAIIVYQGFVTDFSKLPGAYELGSGERQRVTLSLSQQDPQEVATWHRLTSGLTLTDVDGEAKGAVCPDGEVNGYDEDCEQGVPITETCQTYGLSGDISCNAQTCKLDLSGCSCTNADGDGFNLSGQSCGTQLDCNDNRSQVIVGNMPVYNPDGRPLTGKHIYPGATEWCDNGVDENCNGEVDEPSCTPPPPPPLVCNFNSTCDEKETDDCRDCREATAACPSAPELVKRQGKYNISVRATINNTPELIIKTADTGCLLDGKTMLLKGTRAGELVLFQDPGGNQVLLRTGVNWTITGASKDPGTSEVLKSCWGVEQRNGADLLINIEINSIDACTPSSLACTSRGGSCVLDAECCSSDIISSWCGSKNTCERDYRISCGDEEAYTGWCKPRRYEIETTP